MRVVRSRACWLTLVHGVIACCAVTFVLGRAHAFGDLFRFNEPAAQGGGGGRWFTGSPADGYGCEVCHRGESSREVVVQGLPAVYQPGASYDVFVRWPLTSPRVTALVELTDELGHGAGSVLIPDSKLTPEESCAPAEDGIPAALVLAGAELNLANNRQLVGMQDCGGSVLHWIWTAPAIDMGTVLFTGGLVESDAQQNAEGDRVAGFFRAIGSPSKPERRVELSGGCAMGGAGSSAPGCFVFVLFWLIVQKRSRVHETRARVGR